MILNAAGILIFWGFRSGERRKELLDGLFEAWDYDGSGALTLEDLNPCLLSGVSARFSSRRFQRQEILPFYMKSSQKHDVLEPQARGIWSVLFVRAIEARFARFSRYLIVDVCLSLLSLSMTTLQVRSGFEKFCSSQGPARKVGRNSLEFQCLGLTDLLGQASILRKA